MAAAEAAGNDATDGASAESTSNAATSKAAASKAAASGADASKAASSSEAAAAGHSSRRCVQPATRQRGAAQASAAQAAGESDATTEAGPSSQSTAEACARGATHAAAKTATAQAGAPKGAATAQNAAGQATSARLQGLLGHVHELQLVLVEVIHVRGVGVGIHLRHRPGGVARERGAPLLQRDETLVKRLALLRDLLQHLLWQPRDLRLHSLELLHQVHHPLDDRRQALVCRWRDCASAAATDSASQRAARSGRCHTWSPKSWR
mmetsp:Transcript_58698/g.163801  ORF Transcript_58698/g.163801 Transcript_58698/m.163801 type:complete len:265 (-) Transcript_58698:1205-1999(-)